ARGDEGRHLHHRGRSRGAAGAGAGLRRDARRRARRPGDHPRAVRRAGRRRAAAAGRGPRPRDQGEHPADDGAAGGGGARAAGHVDARRRPRGRPGRALLLQRPRGPGGHHAPGHAAAGGARAGRAVLRHLLRQPALRAGARLRHLQAPLRPPRHQPAGDGPHHRPGRGDRPQPRLRRRRPARGVDRDAVGGGDGQPRLPQRRRRRGAGAPRRGRSAAVLLGAVPPRGGCRAARRGVPLRPVLRPDGDQREGGRSCPDGL
ncbi:MAG: Carbamoyl-phosphate synthase small chain, partial [uncultured Friedmanniella sp.]